MTDRRPLNDKVVVPKPGGGTQPRSRNEDGRERKNALTQVKKVSRHEALHKSGLHPFINIRLLTYVPAIASHKKT